jgi:hypothetical protein
MNPPKLPSKDTVRQTLAGWTIGERLRARLCERRWRTHVNARAAPEGVAEFVPQDTTPGFD